MRAVDKVRGPSCVALAASLLLGAATASADPPWASRRMTLGDGELALDIAAGIGDYAAAGVVGSGTYLEVGYGITRNLEIVVRDGVRFGEYGEYARADQYGRLYTTSAGIAPSASVLSNPGASLLWRFVGEDWVEVGAFVEAQFPVEPHTSFAGTVGVPVTFHYAPWLRFDTGAYLTMAFGAPVEPTYEIPLELWFQTGKVPLWFGPLTAVQTTGSSGVFPMPLGFGAGYAVNRDIDLRAEALFPQLAISPSTRDVGFGFGVELRH